MWILSCEIRSTPLSVCHKEKYSVLDCRIFVVSPISEVPLLANKIASRLTVI